MREKSTKSTFLKSAPPPSEILNMPLSYNWWTNLPKNWLINLYVNGCLITALYSVPVLTPGNCWYEGWCQEWHTAAKLPAEINTMANPNSNSRYWRICNFNSEDLSAQSETKLLIAASLATILWKHFNLKTPVALQVIDKCPLFVNNKDRRMKNKCLKYPNKVTGSHNGLL